MFPQAEEKETVPRVTRERPQSHGPLPRIVRRKVAIGDNPRALLEDEPSTLAAKALTTSLAKAYVGPSRKVLVPGGRRARFLTLRNVGSQPRPNPLTRPRSSAPSLRSALAGSAKVVTIYTVATVLATLLPRQGRRGRERGKGSPQLPLSRFQYPGLAPHSQCASPILSLLCRHV